MSKLVVSRFMTLDDVIEAPGGGESFERGGWAFEFDRGAERNQFKLEELQKADARLRLMDATPVGPDGVIILTYEPAATAGQGPDGGSDA